MLKSQQFYFKKLQAINLIAYKNIFYTLGAGV